MLSLMANDRIELKMKYGEKIELTCKSCKTKKKYKINDIKAEQGIVSLVSFVVVLVLIVLAIYFLWDYAIHQSSSRYLIPVAILGISLIYSTINKEENNKVRNFNRS